MSSSLSESPILESQQFTMHQIMRMTTIPEAIPTVIRIPFVSFWKENSNRATKNTQTLKHPINHYYPQNVEPRM